jgi:hypothetical protein
LESGIKNIDPKGPQARIDAISLLHEAMCNDDIKLKAQAAELMLRLARQDEEIKKIVDETLVADGLGTVTAAHSRICLNLDPESEL